VPAGVFTVTLLENKPYSVTSITESGPIFVPG